MTKGAPVHNGEKIASSINGVGRTGLVHAKRKKETWPPTYTIHENKLKMVKRPDKSWSLVKLLGTTDNKRQTIKSWIENLPLRKKDSWATMRWLLGGGVIRGLNGNGKKYNKD